MGQPASGQVPSQTGAQGVGRGLAGFAGGQHQALHRRACEGVRNFGFRNRFRTAVLALEQEAAVGWGVTVGLVMETAVAAEKHQVRPVVPDLRLEGGEAAVVRHVQVDDTLGEPRGQRLLDLGLFFFHIEPGMFRVQIVWQGGE